MNICDADAIQHIFSLYQPDMIMHLAAESHVDRSIDGPADFIYTNIVGTYQLLEATRKYWMSLEESAKQNFRFHHISTDEVYDDLEGTTALFKETTSYASSSASKASSDHLIRAWHRTYGLPVIITNCSNNYGPYHFTEKLIPLIILNALEGKPLPVYGQVNQVRDWLFIEDHARALYQVVTTERVSETYNIGGHNEKQNIDVVRIICKILDELKPRESGQPYESLITFVKDRPGHDLRYAIDATKIKNELGWVPTETFETGILKTIQWYLNNLDWCRRVQDGSYQRERLGINL